MGRIDDFLPYLQGESVSRYAKRILGIAIGVAVAAGVGSAQPQRNQPKRPDLPKGADRNDPWTYYRIGQLSLRKQPGTAADAFYWATRLNPVWAEAYYGRRVALLLRDPRRLALYFRGDKNAIKSKEAMESDSIYVYALTLNPFLGPQLDYMFLETLIQEVSNQVAEGSGVSSNEIAYELDKYLSDGPPEWRALVAYRDGRFGEALSLYAKAISKSSRGKAGLLAERGRLFYQLAQHDSALVTLTQALAEMRKADKNDLVYLYQSKALMEQRIGMIQRVKGNNAAARAAFGRALEEDLSYFPAHVQLAYLGLDTGDTATVMTEMDLAVQIKPEDAGLRYQYGYALGSLHKLNEAEVQLRKAIELNPDFAIPHYVLGQVYQASNRKPEALKEFQAFLALSALSDPRREDAGQMAGILAASQ